MRRGVHKTFPRSGLKKSGVIYSSTVVDFEITQPFSRQGNAVTLKDFNVLLPPDSSLQIIVKCGVTLYSSTSTMVCKHKAQQSMIQPLAGSVSDMEGCPPTPHYLRNCDREM